MTSTRRTITTLVTLATVVTTALAGCGSDDDSQGTDGAVGSATVVEVTALDYAYDGLAGDVPAGTEFRLINDSDVEAHEFVAVRLDDDETREVAELVTLPPEEFGALLAGVETVIIAPPGAPGMVVEGTGVLTEPGRYAIVCVIPTGADPDEYLAAAAAAEGGPPEVEGGPPHIAEGMFAELTVTG